MHGKRGLRGSETCVFVTTTHISETTLLKGHVKFVAHRSLAYYSNRNSNVLWSQVITYYVLYNNMDKAFKSMQIILIFPYKTEDQFKFNLYLTQ
jgi:hypothetical protein